MDFNEFIRMNAGANINVTINIQDLRNWQEEFITTAREQIEATKKAEDEKEFLTPKEVMEKLGVSQSTLTRWRISGYLVPVKLGKFSKYPKSEIEALLRKP